MSLARQYLANLASGFKLSFLLPAPRERIHGSAPMLLLLFATAVLLHLARDFAVVGTRGSFSIYGLPGVLLYIPLLLAAAVAVAWITNRSADALVLATALAALSLPILAVELFISALASGSGGVARWPRWIPWEWWQWAFPTWLAIASVFAAFYLLRPGASRLAASAIALIVLVALPLGSGYRERALWSIPYDENAVERSQYFAAASEDALYQQPKLLARTLASVAPGRAGLIDLYYVGFGGYAQQDVFLREIRSVEKLMQEQFGARGRTASLLNNPKTVMDTPIASGTSLRTVLKRVGEVMNRDEDVLFLFMTSHGAKDHRFSLEFWPLRFNDLTPQVLRSALDDAGIQWRVIVVSACYAGGFIDALKNERTIVVAAAGPDKKSFGCSHEAEWTYFGKAFFDEALRDQPRLTDAFARAREAVAAREEKDNVESRSDPQIAGGKSMVDKWDAYLAQRRNPGSSAPASAPTVDVARDAVEQLVDLSDLAAIARTNRSECLREMAAGSPSTFADKDPNYFGDITKASPQWPKLMTAWEQFAEDYCTSASNVGLLRRAYMSAWRDAADDTTVRAALKYLGTREGRKLLQTENRVASLVGTKIVEFRRDSIDKATSRYYEKLTRLQAEARRTATKPR
jgi:hypothetical protein